jgi:zinc protease
MMLLNSEKIINFIEYDLPNGLHIILHKDITNPLLLLNIFYHVGSKNEMLGYNGFAHFFEHLIFEGSKNIKKREYVKFIHSNGGIINASTSYDLTHYYDIVPSNCLKLIFWIESDKMINSQINKKSMDIQLKVIEEEKKQILYSNSYSKIFLEKIPNLLFKKHPYKFPILGSIKDLRSLGEEDYKNFYNTFYVPENATLILSGNFSIKNTKKLIEDYFSFIPKGKKIIIRPNVKEDPIKKEIFYLYKDKNIKVPALFIAYRIPNKKKRVFHILKLIKNILVNGESSYLIKNIINKKKLSTYIECFFEDLEDYGIFCIFSILSPKGNLDKLTEAIDKEMEKLKNDKINKNEIKKNINILKKNFFIKNSSMYGICTSLGKNHIFYKNTNYINSYIKEYNDISPEEVKNVLNKYLNKNQRVRLYDIPNN